MEYDHSNSSNVVNNLSIGFYKIDLMGNLISYNPFFIQLIGIDTSYEFDKINILELAILPIPEFDSIIELIKLEGKINNYPHPLNTLKGDKIFVFNNSYGIYNDNGSLEYVEGALMHCVNLRNEVNSNSSLQKTESLNKDRYSELLDNIPIGMHFYELNETGNLIFTGYNKAADIILNFEHSKIVNLKIEDAFNDLIHTGIPAKYKYVALTGESFHTQQINYKDSNVNGAFEVFAFSLGDNKMVAAFFDISDKKRSELALRASELKNKLIIENLPMGIIIYNKGNIVYANKSILSMLKYDSFFHFSQNNLIELIDKSDRDFASNNILELYSNPNIEEFKLFNSFESKMICADGSNIYCDLKAITFNDSDELSMLVMVENITKRKLYEGDIWEAKERAEESDRLKTAFLSNISHEIRTPMNGIIGFSKILANELLSNEDRLDFSQAIADSCYRLLNVVTQIIDVSKIEQGQMLINFQMFNLNELFYEIYYSYREVAQKKNISFIISNLGLNNEDSNITHDLDKFRTILTNLIDNSLKFTYFGNVEFGYDIIDNNIIIYVNDTGIGISEEFKNKIFQAFSQENISISRSHEGAGLGLSIVKGLVDLVKGNITIDSKQGQGTCIRINIPLKSINDDSPISTLSIKQILKEKVMNNKKILIVEDDKINFIFLQRILISNFNSEILHASDGEKAIEIFRDNPDIDVVLMDLKLPKVDGLTASKEILKINPSIPIIAVTAFANPESHTLAIDAGCKSVIVKPYEAEDLFKAIYKVLKEIGVKKS